jgi:hypothetical protein
MRLSLLPVLACGALLCAQDPVPPTPAADAKLTQALQKAASSSDTGFAASWGPIGKKADAGDAIFARMMGGAATSGACAGSWHADRLHVTFDGDEGDELLLVGRRMLAKDDKGEWTLRSGRFRDGNRSGFVPDVPLLLEQLARWNLPIAARRVGSLDDRPIEILSLTLGQEQVGEAFWSGALPDTPGNPFGGGAMMLVAGAGGAGGGARTAAAAPDATVDVALWIDPATSVIHKLHCRVHAKADAGAFGRVRVVRAGGAGGAVQVAGDDDEGEDEAEEEAAEAQKDAPLEYVDGLPKRSKKKMSVSDYTVTLKNHGQQQPPALTELQQRLLGR